ncbi:MAG: hypothetical protein NDF54_04310 [archaeon GB-1867-035]|nr:hypothetical protein [Candidatus Culexmicrobium profundum]
MPNVRLVLLFGPLRGLVGKEEITVEAKNLKEVLIKLIKSYGENITKIFFNEKGKGHSFNFLIINGVNYSVDEVLRLEFPKDVTIYVWPALDGG